MIKLTDVITAKDIEIIQTFYPEFDGEQIFKTDNEWVDFVENIQDMVIPFLSVETPSKEAIAFDDIVYKISDYEET